jgi:hypothetical protein
MWRRVRMPPPYPCELEKATKREPSAWEYNYTSLSLGNINTGISGPPGWGLVTRLATLFCKKITIPSSKEVETDGLIQDT